MSKYQSKTFNYTQDFKSINFRNDPQKYQVGVGEQGVLMVEPYKSEILPHWRFKNPEIAKKSAKKIYSLFQEYKKKDDFVGMDMARKFLQMGYTRARRYANHPTGKKYFKNPQKEKTKIKESKARTNILPQSNDWATNEKAQAARIFYDWYKKANTDTEYAKLKAEHKRRYG